MNLSSHMKISQIFLIAIMLNFLILQIFSDSMPSNLVQDNINNINFLSDIQFSTSGIYLLHQIKFQQNQPSQLKPIKDRPLRQSAVKCQKFLHKSLFVVLIIFSNCSDASLIANLQWGNINTIYINSLSSISLLYKFSLIF